MTSDQPATDLVETHVSMLFFVGDHVYKLRKPVRFGFVDFTRRVDRLADCQREVALNRRLTSDVYLGVADVVLDGKPLDHMVVMRRLPRVRRLSVLARNGAALDDWLPALARVLADFHRGADRSETISSAATSGALLEAWAANFSETAPFVGSALDPEADAEIQLLARRWIAGRDRLLRSRAAGGWICDGHGDLQADDIFCLDQGIEILDCLEFSDRLRYGDVAADLAFLLMDLERLGRRDAAQQMLALYEEFAGAAIPPTLVEHYCALRAYIRAKVAALRSAQGVSTAIALARQLHGLALDHLRSGRVVMVMVGGLPGSGKSTLARSIGSARGWSVLRSDEIRDDLFASVRRGDPRYLAGRYDAQHSAHVYRELVRRARDLVEEGISVVLDASWTDEAERSAARAVAVETDTDLVEICCLCEAKVADRRIAQRRDTGGDPSEATAAIRASMAENADPWPSALSVDTTTRTPGEVLDQVSLWLPQVGDLR
jgi:uncharacterized protein